MAVFMVLQLLSIMFKTIFKNLIFNTIDTNQPDQSDLLMELGTNKKKVVKSNGYVTVIENVILSRKLQMILNK